MIVLDLETTGLNEKKHSIVSIGAVDYEDPSERFYLNCRRWPGAKIQDGALEINGFSKEEIDDEGKPTESEAIQIFYQWFLRRDCKIFAGQNVFFDNAFMRAAFRRAGIDFKLSHHIYDLHTACLTHIMQMNLPVPMDRNGKACLASDDIASYVGLPAEAKPHISINGALWEAEAISRLTGKGNLIPEFADFKIPSYLPGGKVHYYPTVGAF